MSRLILRRRNGLESRRSVADPMESHHRWRGLLGVWWLGSWRPVSLVLEIALALHVALCGTVAILPTFVVYDSIRQTRKHPCCRTRM
jgi:hypothetical protein